VRVSSARRKDGLAVLAGAGSGRESELPAAFRGVVGARVFKGLEDQDDVLVYGSARASFPAVSRT
jgi:hypothetical protein